MANKYNALEKIPVDYGYGEDVYHSERHLIGQIANHPEKNISELAEFMGVTKGAISQTVKKLEKKKLILRYKGKDNEKEVFLKLTPTGENVFIKHKEVNQESIMPFYKELAKHSDEKIQFLREMFKWIDAFLDESKEKMKIHVKDSH